MKVVCFGASVTQQERNHVTNEITGYAPHLRALLSSSILDAELEVIAAGSAHFDCAGYSLLSDVIVKSPDVLILDWHATGLDRFNQLQWHSFISELLDNNILILIAVFPRRSCFESRSMRPNFYQAEEVCCETIKIVDGYQFRDFSPEKHLRDEVHTTPAGALLYAENLFAEIDSLIKMNPSKSEDAGANMGPFYIASSKRPSVGKHVLCYDSYLEFDSIELVCTPDGTLPRPAILFDAFIGPDSPVLLVQEAGSDDRLLSLWDPWCHFSRNNYRRLELNTSFSNPTLVNISIAEASPDYASCANKNFDFSPYVHLKKAMRFRQIFAIGAYIEILNLGQVEISG
jgi:hypothetical protein